MSYVLAMNNSRKCRTRSGPSHGRPGSNSKPSSAHDLSRVGSDHVVTFRTTPERREKLLHMWAEYERVNRITTSEAASFLGKHGFALTPTYGSVGRAALLTLVQRQHGHDVSDTFSTEMKHTSEFFTAPPGHGQRWVSSCWGALRRSSNSCSTGCMIVFQKSVPKGKIQQHSSPVVAMLLGTFTHMNIGQ